MYIAHRTTIHCVCPHGGWDYYDVIFEPEPLEGQLVTTEGFESVCGKARGRKDYQEDILRVLATELKKRRMYGRLEISGRHGSNTRTVVSAKVEE